MEQSKAIKQAAAPAKRPGTIRFFASMGQYIAGVCRDFMQGDLWVKLSALLWGSSCVARGQYVKGVLLTVLEALFAYFIPVVFWPSMSKLGTLGTVQQQRVCNPETGRTSSTTTTTPSSSCSLGSSVAVLLLTAVVLWSAAHIRAARAVKVRAKAGKHVNSFREDIADCFGVKFHRTSKRFPCRCWAWPASPLFP